MDNIFHRARVKLTIFYTVSIIFVFSVGYGFNLLFEKILPESKADPLLLILEIVVIIPTVLTSFWLAGRTLRPISNVYLRQKKFVADAAHELRTPLAVMKTGTETVLAKPANKKDYHKLVSESLEEINQMTSMVNDLLFLAQNDDHAQIPFQKLDLTRLIDKQVAHMMTYADSKGITLKYHGDPTVYLNGNEAHLKRLLANLLKNAIDYNNQNGLVEVILRKNRSAVELTITDTGIGIAENHLPHIYERFYKADTARTKQASGAGLGLAIAHDIVSAHEGNISIQSQHNKGTTVVVTFPSYS